MLRSIAHGPQCIVYIPKALLASSRGTPPFYVIFGSTLSRLILYTACRIIDYRYLYKLVIFKYNPVLKIRRAISISIVQSAKGTVIERKGDKADKFGRYSGYSFF